MKTAVLSDCVEQWDYLYQAEKGTIYLCRPWPGIAVWANKVFMNSLPCDISAADYQFVKLNYCIGGRCEVLLENGKYVYLTAGMLSIDCNQPKEMFRYPTKQYEGLEVVLNLDELREHPAVILDELGIGTDRVEELAQYNQGSFIARVSAQWDTLAKALVNLFKTAGGSIEDYRFFSLQLLYMLRGGHTFPVKSAYVTKGQRRIVTETVNRIKGNLQMDCTVEQLAKEAVLGVLSAIFANSGSIFDSASGAAAAVGNVGELASAAISGAEALAFIMAVTFNVPCLQAVVSTYQESHSLKWTLRIGTYYICTALILSCIVYHTAVLFL